MLFRRTMLLGVVAAGVPLSLHAQRVAAAPAETSSQGAVRAIAVAIMPWLAQDIFAGTQSPIRHAWRVVVPDTASSAWRDFQHGLYRILNGRAAVTNDSSVYYVEFGPVAVTADTLEWSAAVGHKWRCGGGWTASEVDLRFRSTRTRDGWAPADKLDEVIGDRRPC